jgi:hypothetical protein
MEVELMRCTECGTEMEAGYIPDLTYGTVLPQKWANGAPKYQWLAGIRFDKDNCRAVDTYRCKSCGLLKSYAK